MDKQEELNVQIKLNDHENQIKSLKHRMDEQESNTKVLNSMALSIEKLAINMNVMNDKQEEQSKRLDELESKPTKRWEMVVQIIITTIVGGVIGYFLSRIGM